MHPHESWHNVGQRIRHLRKTQGLTLKQLAVGCDLSTNAISLIERGKVAPTVATLCKIATALGTSASSFLQEICPSEVILLHARNGKEGQPAQILAGNLFDQAIFKNTLAGYCPTDTAKPGGNRQYALCLCGQIEFEDNECQSHLLTAGDRLLCNGNALQRWHNRTGETAIVILVIPGQTWQSTFQEVE
jgi:transcriptional regulator with XRE-family HTH domain